MAATASFPSVLEDNIVWTLTRAEVRRALADTGVDSIAQVPHARSVTVYADNSGVIQVTSETTLRDPKAIGRSGTADLWLAESPAPLPEQHLQSVTHVVTAAIPGFVAAAAQRGLTQIIGWQVDLLLTADSVDIATVTGVSELPVAHGASLSVVLRAKDAATIQGWRQVGGDDAGDLLEGTSGASGDNAVALIGCLAKGTQVQAGQTLATLVVCTDARDQAFVQAADILSTLRIDGPNDNRGSSIALLQHPDVIAGDIYPTLSHQAAQPDAWAECTPHLVIQQAGIQTTVQDAGRIGAWEVGVPPSGPMDTLGLALANEAVGNTSEMAGLEITLGGLTATVTASMTIAIGGAPCAAQIDGKQIPYLTPVTLAAGQVLMVPPPKFGFRMYLAVRGGIDTSVFLSSRATFTLGNFGGYRGRALAPGDLVPLVPSDLSSHLDKPQAIPAERHPTFSDTWQIGVRLGPHTDPDFITAAGIQEFFSTPWTVSPQSNRTGVRLQGPRPQWARDTGGEAGLHPSNLHDNAYAFGAIDLTGDTPVVLGPDGPSLGGFVCPGIVVSGQRWKLGQVKPGDTVEWVVLDADTAQELRTSPEQTPVASAFDRPEIIKQPAELTHPGLCLRRQGDEFLLLEYGPMELDLALRLRVQALYQRLLEASITGVIDLTPGIRSLQVHYNPDLINEARLTDLLQRFDAELSSGDLVVPSRKITLPLSWDDPSTREAIDIYMRTVNENAPWCPWNIEFIRRINGFESVDDVYNIVFSADYLVYGLGDVYLGAPVATPMDPRHRMVTTKYNPARTWTPENAVGIGGAYMCIYGMEGPGGYQFVGRTVQVWDTYTRAACYEPGVPWLLRQFDQLSYEPVDAEELLSLRMQFAAGHWQPKIVTDQISLREQQEFATVNAESIAANKQRQQAAFAAERERWRAAGLG